MENGQEEQPTLLQTVAASIRSHVVQHPRLPYGYEEEESKVVPAYSITDPVAVAVAVRWRFNHRRVCNRPLTASETKRSNHHLQRNLRMVRVCKRRFWLLGIFFWSIAHESLAFVPLYPGPSHLRHAARLSVITSASLEESLETFSQEFARCSGAPEIQKMLVQKGIEFRKLQATGDAKQSRRSLRSGFQKVPGCTSNIIIQTSLHQPQSEQDEFLVSIQGDADALIGQGMMAVLITALSSSAVGWEDICGLDPNSVADQLGIRRALSPGRNDGLANMMKLIQQQIHSLLESAEPKTESIAPLFVDQSRTFLQPPHSQMGNATQQSTSSGPAKTNVTVALLLSGGVDSSVALRLLQEQGYDITAFYLRIWLEDELAHLGQCPWEDDYDMCRQVCEQAGVPLESISLQEEYRDRVISYTIHEAQRGRTPNPDVLCNSRIKFGCFYDAIATRDFDFVASGHYACLEPNWANSETKDPSDSSESAHEDMRLFRAPDPVKDQSYFLCALSQEQLRRVIFPLGNLQKSEVRALAEKFQLPNRHRADSQGLCFLGKVKFEEFLGAYLGERPGDIVDAANGDVLGRHKGVWFHTVGQRKGIGKVLHPLATSRGPWYVVAKDPAKDLVICSNQYDEEIFTAARSEFHVEDIHWVAGVPPRAMEDENGAIRFDMKIRHGPRLVQGDLMLSDANGDTATIKLIQKDGGLAPGQYVVFYHGEECLGGGVISERHWAKFLLQQTWADTVHNQTARVCE